MIFPANIGRQTFQGCLFLDFTILGALVVYLMTLKSTVMALQGPRQSYAPPSPRRGTRRLSQAPPVQRKQGINGMVLRGRFQQILFYVPTFGEGHHG